VGFLRMSMIQKTLFRFDGAVDRVRGKGEKAYLASGDNRRLRTTRYERRDTNDGERERMVGALRRVLS